MMRRALMRAWTDQEIEKLKLIAQGVDGIILSDRTQSAIRSKMQRLGLLNKQYKWSNLETQSLKHGGHIQGRTASAIKHKRLLLGIRKISPRLAWSQDNIRILREAYSRGLTAQNIYEEGLLPNVSKFAIQNKMSRLKLLRKHRSQYAECDINDHASPSDSESQNIKSDINNQASPIDAEQHRLCDSRDYNVIALFDKFLSDNWLGNAPEELVDSWNEKNHRHRVSYDFVVEHLANMNIKISDDEAYHIRTLKEHEKLIRISNQDIAPSDTQARIRAERIEMIVRRMSENKDIWTGLKNADDVEDEQRQSVH